MSKKKTGLGTDAFFQQSQSAKREKEEKEEEERVASQPTSQTTEEPAQEKPEKMRTTITMYPETRAGLEMLKIQELRQGNKVTFSDILDEAIQDLMEKKGVEV